MTALAVVLLSAIPALAGTINAGGFIDYGLFKVSLTGDRGFTFDGGIHSGTPLDPRDICTGILLCAPGYVLSLRAVALGTDFFGHVTLDGFTYPVTMAPLFPSAVVTWMESVGEVVLPAFGTSPSVTLLAPVAFTFQFVHVQLGEPIIAEELVTSAHLRLTLRQNQFEGNTSWVFHHARFELEPVPEPASLLLWSISAAGLGLARRIRRGRAA